MQTREQRYARGAWELVTAFQGDRDKYADMAKQLPALVRTAGLVQALAFVNTRSEEAQRVLLDHLAVVVLPPDPNGQPRTRQQLLQASRDRDLSGYMRLTQEVLDALAWFRRFAESAPSAPQAGQGQAAPVDAGQATGTTPPGGGAP